MEDDDQDRGDEEMREVVEALEREEEVNGWRDNARTHDDMWMNMFFMRHALQHLEPQCDVCTRMKLSRKSLV